MVSNISSALNAYQQALTRIGASAPAAEASPAAQTSSFADLVGNAVENVADAVKNSEATTLANIQGKADIHDVVMAVSNAEIALETVVAVRDTAIKAYQTIMNMPV